MNSGTAVIVGLLLLALNAFFVAVEYALVSVRRTRIEALAKGKSRRAKLLLGVLDKLPRYIAACQVGVSLCSIAIGLTIDALFEGMFKGLFGPAFPDWASLSIGILIGTFITVILGELLPKYLSLKFTEGIALATVAPIRFFSVLFSPFAAAAQWVTGLLVRPFGIDVSKAEEEQFSREELLMLVREGGNEGTLDQAHATVVGKALRFDKLDAEDIMVHRLDIKWVGLDTPRDALVKECMEFPHSRVLVCGDDLDDVLGVLYTRDLLKSIDNPGWELSEHLREAERVPPNLSLTKIIERMREAKTQILIVSDEYGGTNGLITLEDVVEEVFGELDDALEGERPPIERTGTHRLSARAEVRYDEVLDFIGKTPDGEMETATLAQMIIDALERTPKVGDAVEFEHGKLHVENMARQRITRVRILLNRDVTL